MDSAQQLEEEDEEEQPQKNDQSQEVSKAEEGGGNRQVQMGDIHREKKNLDGAEIATKEQSQSALKELDSAQEEEEEQRQDIPEQYEEESKEVEEGDIKKMGDILHISIQREKKNLDGRTISRDGRTQEYLDSLIRGNDTNLENGLSKAMCDFFGIYTQYPDADFDSLVCFVTDLLGLIDVPSKDLVSLRHIITKLRKNFQAVMNETNEKELDFWDQNQNQTMWDILDYKATF